MRIWCYKNKYLITSRHNQGFITRHSPEDCVECNEEKCQLFNFTRNLSSNSIRLYMQWLGDSPLDVIAYNEGYDIFAGTKIGIQEHQALKLFCSLPPELYDEFWIKLHEDGFGNYNELIEEIRTRASREYENWDPLQPYWQNLNMRRKNE